MPDEASGFVPESELPLGLPPRDDAVTQTLHENTWLSLLITSKPSAGVNGYVFSHETRCLGRIVAVLPYRETADGREYLVKSEVTPCWGYDQVRSAVTGGWEGGDIEDDAVRELLEETGYAITRDELIALGESFASKSADTRYSLFSVDLTGREQGEALGDGTRLESESAAIWVDLGELAGLEDPQLHVMFLRLTGLQQLGAEPAGAVRLPLAERVREDLRHLLAASSDLCSHLPEWKRLAEAAR